MSLADNARAQRPPAQGLLAGGFIKAGKARDFAAQVIQEFDVSTPGVDALARSLSGGNLQKFVVGREVLQTRACWSSRSRPGASMPGAAAAIHQALITLAAHGAAVVVISQDLDELLMLTDRLAVINVGVLSDPLATATASVEEIGLLMGGAHGMARARAWPRRPRPCRLRSSRAAASPGDALRHAAAGGGAHHA